jgi:hypothetical protein
MFLTLQSKIVIRGKIMGRQQIKAMQDDLIITLKIQKVTHTE